MFDGDRMLKTVDIRERTGWSLPKIRRLILAGKLPAIDTSSGERPIWEVRLADLEAFLRRPALAIAERESGERRPVEIARSRRRIDENVPRRF